MKFIDLFAGLGGFHKALHELGHQCVFASEINPMLRELYEKNWGIKPSGDIRYLVKNHIDDIPPHDILCAGFPCQPFSKAGKQMGLKDEARGSLFDEIIEILEYRKPNYFILENVPHIAKHDNEETWKIMSKQLNELGYSVKSEYFSPHEFGVPQHRTRIFIVGSQGGLSHFSFEEICTYKTNSISLSEFIDTDPKNFKEIPKNYLECINIWQEFIGDIPNEVKMPGFPIWAMEFGATYSYEDDSYPYLLSSPELGGFKGNFGVSLKNMDKIVQFKNLPSYARTEKPFPKWKKQWISRNRQFYKENKKWLQKTVLKISKLPFQSWQKLEWNVGDNFRDLNKYILQFRASGVRVKSPDFFPSLVCSTTQTPIIGWENRFITPNEGLKLQSLEGIELPTADNSAFKALGNAVNVKIVKIIAEHLLRTEARNVNHASVRKIQQVAHTTFASGMGADIAVVLSPKTPTFAKKEPQ